MRLARSLVLVASVILFVTALFRGSLAGALTGPQLQESGLTKSPSTRSKREADPSV
jgi:hypothetical protein